MKTAFGAVGLVIGAFVALAVLSVVGILWAAGIGIFSAHVDAGVAKRTVEPKTQKRVFDPTNRIGKQELFEQLFADIEGYDAKVAIARQAYEADPTQFNQTNLVGVQQVCVSTVQQYNAEARKITSAIWRSTDLPQHIALIDHCQ